MRFGSAPIRPLVAALLFAIVGLSHATAASAATCAGLHAADAADSLSHCIARGVAELEAAVSIVDELFADRGDSTAPYIYEGGRYDPALGVVYFHRFDRKTTTFFTPRADTLPIAFLPEERLALFDAAGRGAPLSALALGVGRGGPGASDGGRSGPNGSGSPGAPPGGAGPIAGLPGGGGAPNPAAPSGGSPGCGSTDCGPTDPDTPTTSPVDPAATPPLPVPLPASIWLTLAAVAGLTGLVAARRA